MNIRPKIFKSAAKLPVKTKVIDAFDNGLAELFFIRNPQFKNRPAASADKINFLKTTNIKPIWIYYSYLKTAVKTVPEDIYSELRTARNKNIVTKKEQLAFRNLRVGIAGLSVGSSVVSAIVLSGGPKYLKISDFDDIELTNLNRLHANILDLNQNKCSVASKQVWELDPFAEIEEFPSGLSEKNLYKFLKKPKIDVFVDAMDNIKLKISARVFCKKFRIPVIMATDNGNGIILDVERYDQNPQQPIFFGKLSAADLKKSRDPNYRDWIKLAIKILGYQHLSEKIKSSLKEIGKTLYAIPQLGPTAHIAGSAVSFALRKIANKEVLKSGRYTLSLEDLFS